MSAQDRLVSAAARFRVDPAGFVEFAFPWGQPGDLLTATGPRDWQRKVLVEIGNRLRAGLQPGVAMMPVLKAICSGHGVGKSCLLSWLVCWALTTCVDARVVITANTEAQLRTRTWPEVGLWMRRSLFASWFDVQGTTIASVDPEHAKTWRADMATWSENNVEAFAGLHNAGRRILVLMDEASGIHRKVWDTTEGALTDEDAEIIWLVAGNPTQPDGRFFECFHKERHRWNGVQIDSRDVPGTNKALFAQWVEMHGEDSDFVRVRVRGVFPRAGTQAFISPDTVEAAMTREPYQSEFEPLVLGVDVARFGDDQSVIAFRRGRDARSIPWIKLRGADTMQLAARVADEFNARNATAIHVDGGGVGGGVIDRLRQLGFPVREVQFGSRPDGYQIEAERHVYSNKRTEMWASARAWLLHGAIPNEPDLRADLIAPQYDFVLRDGRDAIQLERKQDMKARGLASPDTADALALTFAYAVLPGSRGVAGAPRGSMMEKHPTLRCWPSESGRASMAACDYDPFAMGE